jgi:uncharacterized protein (DUF2336 family)
VVVGQFVEWVESAAPLRRAEAARALCRAFILSPADGQEREAMATAITVMIQSAAADVRAAIADALADSEAAPRHVIATLATDQVSIAAVLIRRSPLFIDGELITLLATAPTAVQDAIAQRRGLSCAVAAAIVKSCPVDICLTLLGNPSALIDDATFARLADRSDEDSALREPMLARRDLTPAVHQRLVKCVADKLSGLVRSRAWMSETRTALVAREATDRATISIAAGAEVHALAALVEHLRASAQLTTALLMRAVCAGQLDFFEIALAALAGVPVGRVASLVRARRNSGLRSIYLRAGLPAVAFDAFATAIDAWGRIANENQADYYRSTGDVTEAALARYAAIADGAGSEVATTLRRFAAEQAREAAQQYARPAAA